MATIASMVATIGLDARDFSRGAKQVADDVHDIRDNTERASSTIGNAFSGLLSNVGSMALSGAFSAISSGIGAVTHGMIAGNAEFEDYNTRFKVLLGSSDAAQQRLKELADFGQRTPFDLPQVVQADIILQGFGLRAEDTAKKFGYSGQQIEEIAGDVASGTGASFEEMANLLGRFSSGATGDAIQRFAELGIASRQTLTDMGLDFDKSGQLLSPLPQAMNVVLTLMKQKYGGLMDAQSMTFNGMVSNLQDWLGNTMRLVGQPIFEVLKAKLSDLLTFLSSAQVKEAINAFAEGLAKRVEEFANWLSNTGIPMAVKAFEFFANDVVPILAKVAGAIGTVIDQLSKVPSGQESGWTDLGLMIAGAYAGVKTGELILAVATKSWTALQTAIEGATTAASLFGSVLSAEVLVPLGLLAAGIAAVGGAAYLYGQIQQVATDDAASYVDKLNATDESLKNVYTSLGQVRSITGAGGGGMTWAPESAAVTDLRTRLADLKTQYDQVLTSTQLDTAAVQAAADGTVDYSGAIDGNTQKAAALKSQMQDLANQILDTQEKEKIHQQVVQGGLSVYNSNTQVIQGVTAAVQQSGIAFQLSQQDLDGYNKTLSDTAAKGPDVLQGIVDASEKVNQQLDDMESNHTAKIAALMEDRKNAKTKAERDAVAQQVAAENEGYATQLQNAAVAYGQEEANQRQHLGQMLIDRVNAEGAISNVAQTRIKEMTDAIAVQFGVQKSTAQTTFEAMTGSIHNWATNSKVSTGSVVQDMSNAEARAKDLKATEDRLTGIYTAKFVDDFQHGRINAEELKAAIATIPRTVETIIHSNAGSVAEEVRGLAGALAGLPQGKIVQIAARMDPELAHHSPSPLEQEMAMVEDFAKKIHTFKIDTKGIDEVTKVVDLMSKVGGIAQSFSKPATDFHLPTSEQVDAIVRTAVDISNKLIKAAAGFKDKALEAAGTFADSASKSINLIGSAADSFAKLDDFKGIAPDKIDALATDIEIATQALVLISSNFQVDAVKTAGDFAENAGKVTSLLGNAVDSLAKVDKYKRISSAAVENLAEDIAIAVEDIEAIALQMDPKAVDAAGVFSEGAGKVISLVSSSVDGFTKLQTYRGVPQDNISALVNDISETVRYMTMAAAGVDPEMLAQVAVFADGVGKVIAPVGNAVNAFKDLDKYKGVAPDRFQALSADIYQAVYWMQQISKGMAEDGLEAASNFADNAGKVVGVVGAAVDNFTKLNNYKGVAPKSMQLFQNDFYGVVGTIQGMLSAAGDAEGYASKFADTISRFADHVRSAMDELASLNGLNVSVSANVSASYGGGMSTQPGNANPGAGGSGAAPATGSGHMFFVDARGSNQPYAVQQAAQRGVMSALQAVSSDTDLSRRMQ